MEVIMKDTTTNLGTQFAKRQFTRREFSKMLFAGAALGIASCSPLKAVFKAYPAKFDRDTGLDDRLLLAFVQTVVPGCDAKDPNAIRIYRDEYFGFSKYLGFFTSDLASRSNRLFGTEQFETLSQSDREKVICSGLDDDATISRLYRGAILMAKASIYAGIYDDSAGCPHIDYHGRNNGYSDDEMFYPNAQQYFAPPITKDGNPN
jgi:hypothetical protein